MSESGPDPRRAGSATGSPSQAGADAGPLEKAPERIILPQADDPRDVVHRAVAALVQGGVVAVPGETCYLLAASALQPEAVERIGRIKRIEPDRGLPIAVRSVSEVADWVPDLSRLGSRLTRRVWPGPVTTLLQGDLDRGLASRLPSRTRRATAPGQTIALRLPAHGFVREVLSLTPGPVVLSNATVHQPSRSFPPVETLANLGGLDMLIEDGPARAGEPTIISIAGESWSIVRPGSISEAELKQMAGLLVVFVCTGNTCRSPMAEALCKVWLARRLGLAVGELEDHGYIIRSAGLAAARGAPAAVEAARIVAARGGSLENHESQPLTHELIEQADWLIPMTGEHRYALLDDYPELAGITRLLDPEGGDIHDPIGCGHDVYRETADRIEKCLSPLFDALQIPHASP
jgi:protein-tyrosine phosphatase